LTNSCGVTSKDLRYETKKIMILAQTELTRAKVTSEVSTLEQDFRLLLRTILRLLKYSKREKNFYVQQTK
jgi:hypothetical protein